MRKGIHLHIIKTMGHNPKPDNSKRTAELISLKLRQRGVLSVQFKDTESLKVDKASNKGDFLD